MTTFSKCPNCGAQVEDDDTPVIDLIFELENTIKAFYGEDVEFNDNGSDTIECCTGCQRSLIDPFMSGRGAPFVCAAA